jgi:hypothetical protein
MSMDVEEYDSVSGAGFNECYAAYRSNKPKTEAAKMAYQLRRIVNRFEDEDDEYRIEVLDDLIKFAEHLKNKIGDNNERN